MIMKNLSAGKLYLHCEECESAWNDPQKIDDHKARFLAIDEEFESEAASWEDVVREGWQQFAANVAEA
jgi:hypothetical protein